MPTCRLGSVVRTPGTAQGQVRGRAHSPHSFPQIEIRPNPRSNDQEALESAPLDTSSATYNSVSQPLGQKESTVKDFWPGKIPARTKSTC